MTLSDSARAAVLARALQAAFRGDEASLRELCVDDVVVWAPATFVTSLDELVAELAHRDEALSAVDLTVSPLDVGGGLACAEWTAAVTHVGPIVLAGGPPLDPTGMRLHVNGVAVAEFRGARICAARQYWDELSVLEQLGVLRPPEERDGD